MSPGRDKRYRGLGEKTFPTLPPKHADTIRPSSLGSEPLEVWLRINPEISKVETSQGLSLGARFMGQKMNFRLSLSPSSPLPHEGPPTLHVTFYAFASLSVCFEYPGPHPEN